MASSLEAVNEMLVKKSADYAGRPQPYTVYQRTLGELMAAGLACHVRAILLLAKLVNL